MDTKDWPFHPGRSYTRQDVYHLLNVPGHLQRGHWETGYHQYDGAWFVFATIGTKALTGHDYGNHWEGEDLFWHGRPGSRIFNKSIKDLTSGGKPVLIFTRGVPGPFTFKGTATARDIRDTIPVTVVWILTKGLQTAYFPNEVSEPEIYFEGATRIVSVNVYERDQIARAKCLSHYGTKCAVCDLDFGLRYGEIGEGFIHVHHLKPLSEIVKEYKDDPIEDLRPICPNCHAMSHRRNPPLTIEELRRLLRNNLKIM